MSSIEKLNNLTHTHRAVCTLLHKSTLFSPNGLFCLVAIMEIPTGRKISGLPFKPCLFAVAQAECDSSKSVCVQKVPADIPLSASACLAFPLKASHIHSKTENIFLSPAPHPARKTKWASRGGKCRIEAAPGNWGGKLHFQCLWGGKGREG